MAWLTICLSFSPSPDVNAPLRHLLKELRELIWDLQQNEVFKKMKELIIQEPDPFVTYFDPSKELRLQVDALKYELDAALTQTDSYTSKSLNDSKVHFAQIGKELTPS